MPDPAGGRVTDMSALASLAAQARARVAAGSQGSEVIRGADTAFMGPLQPLKPITTDTDAQVIGRRFDYQAGYNLQQAPRVSEGTSFWDLRNLANNCDVMHLVIETRKDQLCSLEWQIRVRPDPDAKRGKKQATTPAQQSRIDMLTDFFLSPDRQLPFETWLRVFLDDHFVIDAPVLYRRMTMGGQLFGLENIDGATIMPKLDGTGRTPIPPDVAYQQIIKGLPVADYTTDNLYYLARNLRSYRVYGCSPVEQVLITANTAIRRALFQLEYYTKGSQPDAFLGVPGNWNIDQVKDFQNWIDSLQQQRRALRVVPGDMKYTPTKEPVLKDDYDDYLNRVICFAFSISPTALVKMMNRATSESQKETAIQEGLMPLMGWVERTMTRILRREFDAPDLEFGFIDDRETDPKEQAEIDDLNLKNGKMTIDETRERDGLEPFGGVAGSPMVLVSTGYVPIDANIPVEQGGSKEPTPAPLQIAPPGNEPPNQITGPKEQQQSEPDNRPAEKIHDHHRHEAGGMHEPSLETVIREQVQGKINAFNKRHVGKRALAPAGAPRKAITAARAKLRESITKQFKAHAPAIAHTLAGHLHHLLGKQEDPEVQRALNALDLSMFGVIAAETAEEAAKISAESGFAALARIGVENDSALFDQVNTRARDYAKDRAAWLVGKRINEAGAVVDNPNAAYAIDEATRDDLRATITDAIEKGLSQDELVQAIIDSYAFSEARAETIARTEIATANNNGALDSYKAAAAAGVELEKQWGAVGPNPCPICLDNEAEGPIPIDDTFQSGDDAPDAHPNCYCVLIPILGEEGESEKFAGVLGSMFKAVPPPPNGGKQPIDVHVSIDRAVKKQIKMRRDKDTGELITEVIQTPDDSEDRYRVHAEKQGQYAERVVGAVKDAVAELAKIHQSARPQIDLTMDGKTRTITLDHKPDGSVEAVLSESPKPEAE